MDKKNWQLIKSLGNWWWFEKDWFEIKPDASQNQIKDELGFKQINKLEWAKEIGRKDIEVLKIIETPLGNFKDQGVKVKSLEKILKT